MPLTLLCTYLELDPKILSICTQSTSDKPRTSSIKCIPKWIRRSICCIYWGALGTPGWVPTLLYISVIEPNKKQGPNCTQKHSSSLSHPRRLLLLNFIAKIFSFQLNVSTVSHNFKMKHKTKTLRATYPAHENQNLFFFFFF